MKQNIDLSAVYQTLQTFMGSYFVNYFNRFGRQWQVFVQAEGDYRTNVEQVGQFFVKNKDGAMVPLSAVLNTSQSAGRNSPCATTSIVRLKSMPRLPPATAPVRR